VGMTDDAHQGVGKALGRIPQSLYIMTAQFEDQMRGVMVSFVQQVSFDPPMVMVCLAKGRPIVPLIHDSHAFAVCQIVRTDKLTLKRFARGSDAGESPFQAIETTRGTTGSPIIKRSLAYLDCKLVRHIDIDGDHDMYVGEVRDGNLLSDGEVFIHLRDNGFTY
jgi:flavin reductase (DIM6/NTAB) family NADH-FMN oxidoreductase RutF